MSPARKLKPADLIPAPEARPTIGYVTSDLAKFGEPMWSGIVDVAREQNVNLICFLGYTLLDPANFVGQNNIVFELVNTEAIQGVICWASVLSHYAGLDETRAFLERYRPLPVVTISQTYAEFPSVLMDSIEGMRDLVAHLIETHGYRRLAFIRGPETHIYAQGRYQAYLETLEAHGLPVDLTLVTPAALWGPPSGREAVRLLFDERRLRPRVDIEAIIAVSEDTLMGALEALDARGIRVPEDIAAVGYDDTVLSQTHTPPITTVATPIYETGRQVAETLLALMAGASAPGVMVMPARLVVRQSCGCLDPIVSQAAVGSIKPDAEPLEAALAWNREKFVRVIKQAAGPAAQTLPGDWAESFLESFIADLNDPAANAFLAVLSMTLRRAPADGRQFSCWLGMVTALRRQLLPYLRDNALQRAEDICQQANALIGETARREEAYQALCSIQEAEALRQIGSALITTFDIAGLMDVLALNLPRLGIPSCYLALYEAPQPYSYPRPAPEWSRLALAYTEQGRIPLEPGGRRFRSRELAPQGLWPRGRQFAFVVFALYFRESQLGFVLFEVGPRDGAIYHSLRAQISSALQGALLVRQEELRVRQLQENQQRLLIADKMASLGRLTAGIAHEMNTPLAAARAALAEMKLLIREYQQSLADPQISAADHRVISQEMAQAARLAESAVERVIGFVRGVKAQTRDLAPHERIFFNAASVVEESLLLLTHAVEEARCSLQFEADQPEIGLIGAPGRLAQIVTNLVSNAIDASVEKDGGTIRVCLHQNTECVTLEVSDEGSGIASDNLNRVFDPMFTTKPFGEGTGLGLTIVHEIVVGEFEGTIQVASEAGVGTTFTICLPRRPLPV